MAPVSVDTMCPQLRGGEEAPVPGARRGTIPLRVPF